MNRRIFLHCGAGIAWAPPVIAAMKRPDKLDDAAEVLNRATADGHVRAAVLCDRHRGTEFARSLGLGQFALEATMRCQAKDAAPESGAGDLASRDWDWNSPYWRQLGSPWGGVHASAPDVARFFAEFLHRQGRAVCPETAGLMLRNHNPDGLPPRGLGFAIGTQVGSPGCSAATFGHSGSTGTLAWADPRTDTICVVLTTLPARAGQQHPRALVSDRVAVAVD